MARKQDSFYFDTFTECVDCAYKAAHILDAALKDFHSDNIKQHMDEIHAQENLADSKKHELTNVLVKAFMTPIEREDILLLSSNIDDLVDKIDDVLIRMYCDNITSIRPDALKLTAVLVEICDETKEMIKEFPEFKRSKKLKEHIIKINSLEEKGDKLFIECLRDLHVSSTDPVELMVWHELYMYFEKCIDAAEHVANIVENIVMKNS